MSQKSSVTAKSTPTSPREYTVTTTKPGEKSSTPISSDKGGLKMISQDKLKLLLKTGTKPDGRRSLDIGDTPPRTNSKSPDTEIQQVDSPTDPMGEDRVYELDLEGFALDVPAWKLEFVLKSPRLYKERSNSVDHFDDYSHVIVRDVKWREVAEDTVHMPALEDPLEEFLNPFWEEPVMNENPLREENVFVENMLYEEDVVEVNPLFIEPTEGIPFLPSDDFAKFETDVISLLKRTLIEQSANKTFTGAFLITKLNTIFANLLEKDDVFELSQQLQNFFVFKDIYIKDTKFMDDHTYQFCETMDEMNHGQSHFNRIAKQYSYSSKPCPWRVARNIDNTFKLMCDQFLKLNPYMYTVPPNKSIGYKTLWKSDIFRDLKVIAKQLQKVDPRQYEGDRKVSFLINLYNLMVLHGMSKMKDPNDAKEREAFFKKRFYIVGNYSIDLSMLKNEILFGHGRHSRYRGFVPHPDLAIPFDPRIHFCLHDGTPSSPVLRGEYNEYNLDEQINDSATLFIRTEMIVDDERKWIHMPTIFQEYWEDFGEEEEHVFVFIAKFLPVEQREAFVRKVNTHELIWKRNDTSLNIRAREDEIQTYEIEFHDVRDNPSFRKFFRKFCEIEASTENIDCWEQIIEFRKIEDPPTRFKIAVEIYDTFMAPRATREINVNRKVLVKIREEIELEKKTMEGNAKYTPNVQVTIFDNIHKMLDVIMVDSFFRFRSHEIYTQLVAKFIDSLHEKEDDDKEETPDDEDMRPRGSFLMSFSKSDPKKRWSTMK